MGSNKQPYNDKYNIILWTRLIDVKQTSDDELGRVEEARSGRRQRQHLLCRRREIVSQSIHGLDFY